MTTSFEIEILKKEYKSMKPMSKKEYVDTILMLEGAHKFNSLAIVFWPYLNAKVPACIAPFDNPNRNAPSDPKARAMIIERLRFKVR